MLSPAKKDKILHCLKSYSKKYLNERITELDESGTRIMVNHFLSEVLGYTPIEEIKTEYMIKGTYADYMIQTNGGRHFLVEVKALSLNLSANHLRQAINYGANEGVEWALLTNGKQFDFYKILFNKPIESQKVFSIDLSDPTKFKKHIEFLQFLHKDSIKNKGLQAMWNITLALDSKNIAGMLYAPTVINFIKKELKDKYKRKFNDNEIEESLSRVICDAMNLESIKPLRQKKIKIKRISDSKIETEKVLDIVENIEQMQNL